MVNIACVVSNGYEILTLKNNSINSSCYVLPEFSAETREQAIHEIKKTINSDSVFFDYDSDLINSLGENGDQNVIIMCNAYKWSGIDNNNNNKKYKWVEISEIPADRFISKNKEICNGIRVFFQRRNSIVSQVKEIIADIHDQKKVRIDIDSKIDSLSFWIRTPSVAVPFFYTVEYSLKDCNTVEYITRWRMSKPCVEGDKSDIYLLFAETMSLLLKLLNEAVYVVADNFLGIELEINTAELIIEGSQEYGEVQDDVFADIIVECFEGFNYLMGVHGHFFGSISNNLTNQKNDQILEFLGPQTNFVVREESGCYYNANTGCICFNNGQTHFAELMSKYTFEVLKGITGSLLFSKNAEINLHTNYIPNNVLEKVHNVIERFSIDQYAIVCQSNRLYLVSDNVIWFFSGDFHHSKTAEEKKLISARQEKENALLLVNRKFQWKYPVNSSRFESLVADMLECQNPDVIVRLVGKTNNADGGKDILIIRKTAEKRELTIGQCKAYERSINKSRVTDIRDTLDYYDATGYHLAVTSNLTSALIDHLLDIGQKYDVNWWSEREIFGILRQYPALVEKYNDIIDIVE